MALCSGGNGSVKSTASTSDAGADHAGSASMPKPIIRAQPDEKPVVIRRQVNKAEPPSDPLRMDLRQDSYHGVSSRAVHLHPSCGSCAPAPPGAICPGVAGTHEAEPSGRSQGRTQVGLKRLTHGEADARDAIKFYLSDPASPCSAIFGLMSRVRVRAPV